MYRGDYSRKKSLVDYGFRLPSAFDNRPLKFDEFSGYMRNVIFVSATPGDYELKRSSVAEQIIRPTGGLVDPAVEVRPIEGGQIPDVMAEIRATIERGDRILLTTLTKRLAEELSEYLAEQGGIKTRYLHSEIETIERTEIIRQLRLGKYDVLVGINLLREGARHPRGGGVRRHPRRRQGRVPPRREEPGPDDRAGGPERQREGRALRRHHDRLDQEAMAETGRRRAMQLAYNAEHGITPQTIVKPIREKEVDITDIKHVPKAEVPNLIIELEADMREAAERLEFERAIALRDTIRRLQEGKGR